MHRQPFLHDLLATLQAPTQVWSGRDGQVRADGAQGVYHGDVRVLSVAVVRVGAEEPEALSSAPAGTGRSHIVAVTRAVDGPGADPTARLDRYRQVVAGEVRERLVLSCSTAEPVVARVEVELRADATPMEVVKQGLPAVSVVLRADGDAGLGWSSGDGVAVSVAAPGASVFVVGEGEAAVLAWDVEVRIGEPVEVAWSLAVTDRDAVVGPPKRAEPEWTVPEIDVADYRVVRLLKQSLDDLASLRMSASFAPDDVFLAAGAPWFFTLFGRDSIWAARMMLPLGTELAAGTLRTLAALQGTKVDPATAEQPGKILHEVRRATAEHEGGMVLPPVYYGTVDATPLWVCLLHDAWRAGMPADEVEALLPAMERALAWMSDYGDADGDGFLEYVDESGHGLANQGWKDSGDSVQWRDGRLAEGPIALCEVQGYAYEAAIGGAALFDAFGRPGAQKWRAWAAELEERFREQFWVTDDDGGRYPGIALDADKAVVDTVTSNIGHLLGLGLLSPEEEKVVADRLARSDMDSGRGLRTMAEGAAGFWPLRYHGGAVWPHDTAVVIAGLARGGHADLAAGFVDGLLVAAGDFEWRLPELWAGDASEAVPRTVPYPAACRPQAWSAASAVTVLRSGLR